MQASKSQYKRGKSFLGLNKGCTLAVGRLGSHHVDFAL